MKVILLGAGASKAAGYPLASELISSIESEAHSSRQLNLQKAWKEWDGYLQRASGNLRLLLSCQNPEVVLSVPDLCEAARDASDLSVRREVKRAVDPVEIQRINEYWDSSERAALSEAIDAREHFLACLHWYFALKHHCDARPDCRNRRGYLHRLLAQLAPGDVVATFNWDTTIERTLAEQRRWHPVTGYGFERELRVGRSEGVTTPLPHNVPRSSEITVLKLHGCFGWYRTSVAGGLYFGSSYFLDEFEFDGHRSSLVDPAEPIGPPNASVLAYPSFLKQFGVVEMQKIWSLADATLQRADRVEVWGYSFPESDAAARTLLNVLRARLDRREVTVAVHDPDSQARGRWEEFLGAHAAIDDRKLE